MRTTIILLAALTTIVSSCWDLRRKPVPPPKKVWGYKPVYTVDSSLLLVKSEGPRDVVNPAKIYVRGNLLFQNETGLGIHVINNSDPAHPEKVGFIRIYGNTEMSITGNYLYANAMSDLVVIDISDWQNVVEVKRIKRAFSSSGALFSYITIPVPERNVYYECDNGPWGTLHTGWVRDSIYDQNCFNP